MTLDLAGAGYLTATLASIVVAAVALSRWADDGMQRVFVAVLCGLSYTIGLALILGMVGLLSPGPLLLAHVGSAILLYGWLARRPRKQEPRFASDRRSLPGAAALVIGSGVATFSAVQTVRGRATGEVDSRSYHLANLVEWFRSHTIWNLPYQSVAYFTGTHPGNGEMLGILFLAATGTDQLVYLVPIAFGLLVVLASASVTSDLGGDWRMGALAAVAVIAAPVSFTTQANSLATDLAATSGLVAAAACLLRFRVRPDHRWLLLAGVALGLGQGSKYTILVPAAVLVLAALFLHRARVLWMVPGLVFFAGPWFVRNAITTGNPIFPQGVTVGGRSLLPGGESPLLALSTSMADHMINVRTEVLSRWAQLAGRLYGPVLLLVALGVLAVLFRRYRRTTTLAIAGLAVVAVIGYLITPYTGAGESGLEFLMGSNLRYALTAVFLGVALAAATLPRTAMLGLTAIAIAYDGWKILRGAGFRSDLDVDVRGVAAAGLAAVLLLIVALRWRWFNSLVSRMAVASAVLGLVATFFVTAGAIALVDRSRDSTELERILQAMGTREAILMGVGDLRSVLGPELDREVRTLAAGGHAKEKPYTDDEDLDAALLDASEETLIVGNDASAYPEGWKPDADDWELVESTLEGDVFVRAERQ